MFKEIYLTIYILLHFVIQNHSAYATTAGISSSPSNTSSDCPNYVQLPSLRIGRKCFYIVDSFEAGWHRAMRFCRSNGLELASIISKQENDKLGLHLRLLGFEGSLFWSSGTDLDSEGHFYWMATSQEVMFTNWASPQPDNAKGYDPNGENCLEFRVANSLFWNDRHCSRQSFFICELK